MSVRDVASSYGGILRNHGPFMDQDYDYKLAMEELGGANVLVVGAGGLGCEILKDLALSGIKKISVIDMDTIELTNLNRQFLFRKEHVGESKAIVASKVVMERIVNVEITPYFKRIEDFNDHFYKQFTMVICGLDSIEARRWINRKIVSIARIYNKIIPIIDGGTEGFKGSVKLIIPTYTACFECYMPLIPERISYPLCTLASTPRLPEHCIEWAHQIGWGIDMKGTKFNDDDEEHVQRMFQLAFNRGKEFGIEGITKSKTLGVVKNIIPAIASTNAIISGMCCNEAIKFLTSCNPNMKDNLFYNGEQGVLCETDDYYKLPDCKVCGENSYIQEIRAGIDKTVGEVLSIIKSKYSLLNPIFIIDEREVGLENEIGENFWANATPNGEDAVIIHIIDKTVDQLSVKVLKEEAL